MADNEAEVSVRLTDGRVLTSHVRDATGSLTNPMTDKQLAEKFHGLVQPALREAGCAGLLKAGLGLEVSGDAAAIVALSRPDRAAAVVSQAN